ncbi:acyltransferase family protein [Phenylobacterium kunshanense]|uniref:Acyltransferase 3 domain-containing protein n=1 Tax=Phenylobacterium kunshanense TaxID=1445034 RepID=A0A328BNG9_9CAUL|nr:acyltransferase [Phenylobacterium kunshanense]RAK66548.1 hypothetical protein DJ019_09935 [Phenylobacterium kunshanense]
MTVPSPTAAADRRSASRWSKWLGLQRIDVNDRDNNFYAVRLFLAARVIFGHAFVLGGIALDAGNANFGRLYNSLGVNGFFVISGFLVTRSLLSSKTMTDYVVARVLRIVPALWVMLFVTVAAVVLFASDRSAATLASAGRYLAENLSIIFVSYTIDGVFPGMVNTAINGSIWSLRWEVFCYALLGAVGYVGLTRKPSIVAALTAVLIVAFFFIGYDPANDLLAGRLKLCSLFFFGASLALYAEKILVGVWVGLAAVLLAGVIGYFTEIFDLVYYAFGYLLISISYSKASVLRSVSRALELRSIGKPDLSYGIFLYSFPIQQLLYYYKITSSPVANIALTIMIASICAYLSSQYVEKPTAALRGRVVKAVREPLALLTLKRPKADSPSAPGE